MVRHVVYCRAFGFDACGMLKDTRVRLAMLLLFSASRPAVSFIPTALGSSRPRIYLVVFFMLCDAALSWRPSLPTCPFVLLR